MPRLSRLAQTVAALLAVSACSSASPTEPTPKVEILGIPFSLARGQWSPSVPPVTRTIADLQFAGSQTVSEFALETLRLNGGVVTYTFLAGQMVRAEIDVERLLPLMAPPVRLWSAVTVVNPASWALQFIVGLDHAPTDQDLTAAQNLGGQVLSRSSLGKFYIVLIEDARLPQLRALPGVLVVEFNSVLCLF